tara:strand:+ start:18067 stop:18720 length:654 start_codon:yes stop_codon:yes gene_type:complete
LADIFHDIEDALKQDRLKKLWRWGRWPLAAIIIIIIGIVIAFVLVRDAAETRKLEQAEIFHDAFKALEEGKPSDAAEMYLELAKSSDDPAYLIFSQFRAAEAYLSDENLAGALETYDVIAANTDVPKIYRDLAIYISSDLLLDTLDFRQINEKLAPILLEGNIWRPMAQETLALSAIKAGKKDHARELLSALTLDASAPEGLKDRAAQILAVLGTDK